MDVDWTLIWLKSAHFKTALMVADEDYAWAAEAIRETPDAKIHIIPSSIEARDRWKAALDPDQRSIFVSDLPLAGPFGGSDTVTVDQYLAQHGIRHLHAIKIGAPARACEILAGAQRMLGHARIDFISFGIDASGFCPLDQPISMLESFGYSHAAALNGAVVHIDSTMAPTVRPGAVITSFHGRFSVMLDPNSPQGPDALFDIGEMTQRYGIGIRGIIHLGAHRGTELPTYMRLGAEQILMVEANPYLANRLTQQVDGIPGITVAHCAVNDEDGAVTLNLIENEQASSILPMSDLGRSMPHMVLVGTTVVRGVRLDRLIEEQGFAPDTFNILNVDIQGAELRALRGAEVTLRSIEAINIEINFDEIYEGSAQIDDIDDHLSACGFKRVGLVTPFEVTWGDAFYVRERPA